MDPLHHTLQKIGVAILVSIFIVLVVEFRKVAEEDRPVYLAITASIFASLLFFFIQRKKAIGKNR